MSSKWKFSWLSCNADLNSGIATLFTANSDITSLTYGMVSLNTLNSSTSSTVAQMINLRDCTAIQTISFPNLVSATGTFFYFTGCTALTSASFPELTNTFIGTPYFGTASFAISNNPSLTSISLPKWIPDPAAGYACDFTNNSLNQATVDQILSRFVANAACVSNIIALHLGSNSSPSASGLVDKGILIGRGCTVLTN